MPAPWGHAIPAARDDRRSIHHGDSATASHPGTALGAMIHQEHEWSSRGWLGRTAEDCGEEGSVSDG